MTVLILAETLDPSADLMVMALAEREAEVVRVDLGWFPQDLNLEAELRHGRWTGRLTTLHHSVELEISAIWYRSPTTFRFPDPLSPVERQHAHTEAKLGLGGVLTALPALWVNHPARNADAGYKPVQLAFAARSGLIVPPTLIRNEAAAVHSFARQATETGLVSKLLGAATVNEEGRRKVRYSRRLDECRLRDLRGVEQTAHQFQQWVPKSYEVRMVVIGQRLFSVAIHAHSEAARVDWRSDYPALSYEALDPPEDVAVGVHAVMKELGLVLGAFDFIVTPEGRLVFLEVNPGGQYGWLETNIDVPLTVTLADLLARGAA